MSFLFPSKYNGYSADGIRNYHKGAATTETSDEQKQLFAEQATALRAQTAASQPMMEAGFANIGNLVDQANSGELGANLREQAGRNAAVSQGTALNDMMRGMAARGIDPSTNQNAIAQWGLGAAKQRAGMLNQATAMAEDQIWQRNAAATGLATRQGNSAVGGMADLTRNMGQTIQAEQANRGQSLAGLGSLGALAGQAMFAAKDGGAVDDLKMAGGGFTSYEAARKNYKKPTISISSSDGSSGSTLGALMLPILAQGLKPAVKYAKSKMFPSSTPANTTAPTPAAPTPPTLPATNAEMGSMGSNNVAEANPVLNTQPPTGEVGTMPHGQGPVPQAVPQEPVAPTQAVEQASSGKDAMMDGLSEGPGGNMPDPVEAVPSVETPAAEIAEIGGEGGAEIGGDMLAEVGTDLGAEALADTAATAATDAAATAGAEVAGTAAAEAAAGAAAEAAAAAAAEAAAVAATEAATAAAVEVAVAEALPVMAIGLKDGGGLRRKDFRPGGRVSGPGTETSDSIPALLSDGEYVLNAQSVKMIGKEKLDKLNNRGLRKRYGGIRRADGGDIKLSGGGFLMDLGHIARGFVPTYMQLSENAERKKLRDAQGAEHSARAGRARAAGERESEEFKIAKEGLAKRDVANDEVSSLTAALDPEVSEGLRKNAAQLKSGVDADGKAIPQDVIDSGLRDMNAYYTPSGVTEKAKQALVRGYGAEKGLKLASSFGNDVRQSVIGHADQYLAKGDYKGFADFWANNDNYGDGVKYEFNGPTKEGGLSFSATGKDGVTQNQTFADAGELRAFVQANADPSKAIDFHFKNQTSKRLAADSESRANLRNVQADAAAWRAMNPAGGRSGSRGSRTSSGASGGGGEDGVASSPHGSYKNQAEIDTSFEKTYGKLSEIEDIKDAEGKQIVSPSQRYMTTKAIFSDIAQNNPGLKTNPAAAAAIADQIATARLTGKNIEAPVWDSANGVYRYGYTDKNFGSVFTSNRQVPDAEVLKSGADKDRGMLRNKRQYMNAESARLNATLANPTLLSQKAAARDMTPEQYRKYVSDYAEQAKGIDLLMNEEDELAREASRPTPKILKNNTSDSKAPTQQAASQPVPYAERSRRAMEISRAIASDSEINALRNAAIESRRKTGKNEQANEYIRRANELEKTKRAKLESKPI